MQCRHCQIVEPPCGFKINNRKPGGHENICRTCYNTCNKRYEKNYRQTAKGRANKAWGKILQRVENKDDKNPSYKDIKLLMTKEEFMSWAVPEYEKWFANRPEDTPSIDRMDPNGHYETKNLQMIEWGENSAKAQKTTTVRISGLQKFTLEAKASVLAKSVAKTCRCHHLDIMSIALQLCQIAKEQQKTPDSP
jgi:hypothetical protein